jgi:allantoinase
VIEAFEGKRPAGWLGPWISESRVTPDLLVEHRYTYVLDWCMDDQPVWLSTRNGGRILALPYPQEVNDIPSIVARKDSAAQFADMIVDNFDEMLRQAVDAPLVMGIALHPYLVGQPYRLLHLRRALRHIVEHRERVSITTAGAIASRVAVLDRRN